MRRFSRPLRTSSTAANCPVSPNISRTATGSCTTSRPNTSARPASGSSSVASTRTSVVLPAPLGPSSAKTVPSVTSRSTPERAVVAPKRLTRRSTRTAGVEEGPTAMPRRPYPARDAGSLTSPGQPLCGSRRTLLLVGPPAPVLRRPHQPGSGCGSPNHWSALLSKLVMAQIRSPVRVRTLQDGGLADAGGTAKVGLEGRLTRPLRSLATMQRRMLPRTLQRWSSGAALLGLLALALAGCGSGSSAPPGLTISGPGLQTSKPPWPPEYQHLAERLHEIGIPPGGKETFHIHALLHIYVNGLLSPLPANIGLDPAKGIESSLHTHDSTGIIHMEAPHPFKYTLGDFFSVWGVKLGPAQV